MKILFYIHGLTGGGAERVLVTLADAITNNGDTVVIATNTNIPSAYPLNANISLRNIREGCKETGDLFHRLNNAIIMRMNIRRIAKSEKPDIIVALMSSIGCTVILFTLGLKIPIVVSEHTNVTRSFGLFFNVKRKILYPLASCITVLTKHDYKLWRNQFKNVVRMPNPIDLHPISIRGGREKVVLAAGRVNQWWIKGFDNLIQSWSLLCNDFPEWKLQIAGEADKTSKADIENFVKRFNCVNVEFLGFRRDLKSIMEKSEVFCLSSRIEGLPMVLIEAMNSGCCCVSFDVMTGPNEIITNGKSGLLAKNQDVMDLAHQLRRVMTNAVLRKTMQAKAPYDVQKYDTKKILLRWYILFDKIIKKK